MTSDRIAFDDREAIGKLAPRSFAAAFVLLALLMAFVCLALVGLWAKPVFAQGTAPLPRVALETSAGRIVIEADTARAPISAGNFLRYVDQHRLDGVTFYRDVKVADHFGFVQFGPNGDPRRSLPPIRHEPTTLTGIRHLNGTISTARLAPGTARGEFTISVGDQPGLDADPSKPGDNLGYAAFGHVVEGMDVVVGVMDATVSPDATLRGAFKGEVPVAAVRIVSARRVSASLTSDPAKTGAALEHPR